MAEKPWTEQVIDGFFAARQSPTRSQCDQLALSICEASAVYPVGVPGSFSYTVICTRTKSEQQHLEESMIVSFRESTSNLDKETIELAHVIHGSLVPHARDHGLMRSSDPPLGVYTMPLLPGVACIETLHPEANMDPDEEHKHICFVTHIARYYDLTIIFFIHVCSPLLDGTYRASC